MAIVTLESATVTVTCDLSIPTADYLRMSVEHKLSSIRLPFDDRLWMDVQVEVTTRRQGVHLAEGPELRFQGALVGLQDLQDLLEFCQPRDRAEALAKGLRELLAK